MRATVLDSYGDPQVLHLADVPTPEPGPGQIRIAVAAAAVNPVDLSTRAGNAAGAIPDPVFPMVLGWDAAGRVDAVGDGVTRFAVGDRVIGLSVWFVTRSGTYAEQVVLDESACAPAPSNADDAGACTLPLNGLTAWSALRQAAIEPGDTLLVTGAGGAVGGFVVEVAHARGVRVIGYGRSSDLELIKLLGADEAVDDLSGVAPVARVIDTTGNPDMGLPLVAAGGRLVSVAGKATGSRDDVTIKSAFVRADPEALTELSAMADAGSLTLRVAETMALAEAAAAHERFAEGGVRGRLVLTV
jgi:NADPH:quinone reductase-like Zn-dependent oxidoreductase